jgi:hypothetical protein
MGHMGGSWVTWGGSGLVSCILKAIVKLSGTKGVRPAILGEGDTAGA